MRAIEDVVEEERTDFEGAGGEVEVEEPGLLVFNPSDEFLPVTVASDNAQHPGVIEFYLVPNGRAFNPQTLRYGTYKGVTNLKTAYGTDAEGQARVEVVSARRKAIACEKRYELRGVTRLTGNDKNDERIIENASQKWLRHRLAQASEIVARREKLVKEFHATPANQGQTPSAPTQAELNAMEFLADYRAGEHGDTSKHACQLCGYRTDLDERMAKHMKQLHQQDVSKTELARTDKRKLGGSAAKTVKEIAEATTETEGEDDDEVEEVGVEVGPGSPAPQPAGSGGKKKKAKK